MKELTIEQKAKAYDEAIKRAEAVIKVAQNQKEVYGCVTTILPELNENEDERIRKALICGMNALKENRRSETFATIPIDDCIAWLEKQGAQEPYGQRKKCSNCQFNYAGECKGFCQMKRDEQEPADKVEPEFNEGDWVIFNGLTLYVKEVVNGFYRTISKDGITNSYDWDIDNIARLWTIVDAKEGDVLAYATDEGDSWIMIYWSLYEPYEGHVHYHALLVNDNFSDKGTCCICIDNLKPATKEQRDLLFQKMKQEGYEWDSDKKELKKIESKMLDADKVIEWLRQNTCAACFDEPDEGVSQRIDKFKTDFGLW